MGSTQQELSDQSRGEKEVRWEIKAQELGRYTVSPGCLEKGSLWLSPIGKCLIGKSPELVFCLQVSRGFFVIDLSLYSVLEEGMQLVIGQALRSHDQVNFKILEAALF